MIQRGQIYWVQLDPTVGSEIQKTRPALVVSNDANNRVSNTITVLPITSQVGTIRPYEVLLLRGSGGLRVPSKAKANQIRTVDKQRFSGKPLGNSVEQVVLEQVAAAIKIHLDIDG